ncbi:histone acetyltransferase 1 [Saitoella coloradoensis]
MAAVAIDNDAWATSSNDINFALVRAEDASNVATVSTFHPTFTYSVFGDAETIYGYKGLRVDVRFASTDLKPYLKVQYKEQIDVSLGVEVDDIEEKLYEVMPEGDQFFHDEEDFAKHVAESAKSFRPAGQLLTTYQTQGKEYQIYYATSEDETFRSHLARMEMFVPYYIEGGIIVDLDDIRWKAYVLYERSTEGIFHFVGFCTCYPYYFYDKSIADNIRMRISQFLVLPPFQKRGHGAHLYDTVRDHLLNDPLVREVTVEDPSEAFDELRDSTDMARFDKLKVFEGPEWKAPVDKKLIEETREAHKLAPRQFLRCMEMSLYRNLNQKDKAAVKAFRLQVKARIFRQNKDTLSQIDRMDRLDKLEQTYANVVEDYERFIKASRTHVLEEDSGAPSAKKARV